MNKKRTKRNYVRFVLGCFGVAALLVPGTALMHNVGCLAAVQQAASQDASSQAAKPSLAGTWKLNKDQSDDPRQKMQQAMGNPGGGQGDGQGNGQGDPNRGEGRPGRGGGPGGMMAEWSQLTVTQLDANVKVAGASGRTLTSTTPSDDAANSKDDSSSTSDSNVYGGRRRMAPPAVAQWQGSQLVATGHMFGSGTMTRTYELSPDGKQLYVTTKMTGERMSQPVTYRLVYDRLSASSGNSQ